MSRWVQYLGGSRNVLHSYYCMLPQRVGWKSELLLVLKSKTISFNESWSICFAVFSIRCPLCVVCGWQIFFYLFLFNIFVCLSPDFDALFTFFSPFWWILLCLRSKGSFIFLYFLSRIENLQPFFSCVRCPPFLLYQHFLLSQFSIIPIFFLGRLIALFYILLSY